MILFALFKAEKIKNKVRDVSISKSQLWDFPQNAIHWIHVYHYPAEKSQKNALCSIHQKVIYLMKLSVDNQDQVQVISDLFNL